MGKPALVHIRIWDTSYKPRAMLYNLDVDFIGNCDDYARYGITLPDHCWLEVTVTATPIDTTYRAKHFKNLMEDFAIEYLDDNAHGFDDESPMHGTHDESITAFAAYLLRRLKTYQQAKKVNHHE